MQPTKRVYLLDGGCVTADARVIAVREDAFACDRTCFYPGGGGQPPDKGVARPTNVETLHIESARADDDGVIWHVCAPAPTAALVGRALQLSVDASRRRGLSRYHTALHVLNSIALRRYGGWITGAQIAADYARIDFNLDRLSPQLCAELESEVNAVLRADHAITAYDLPEREFERRGDLLRTLDVRPPVIDGRVRVVEIAEFDAQACGGTHARSTRELGRLSIFRTENKGRSNKRLYVRLDPAE